VRKRKLKIWLFLEKVIKQRVEHLIAWGVTFSNTEGALILGSSYSIPDYLLENVTPHD